jgi:hypothetical protein
LVIGGHIKKNEEKKARHQQKREREGRPEHLFFQLLGQYFLFKKEKEFPTVKKRKVFILDVKRFPLS